MPPSAANDPIRTQQFIDLVRGQVFRRSLLCREEMVPRSSPDPAQMHRFHLTLRSLPDEPSAEDKGKGGQVESFRNPDGITLTTNNPIALAALHALLRAVPSSVPFGKLVQRVSDQLEASHVPGLSAAEVNYPQVLSAIMLQCVMGGFVEANCYPTWFAVSVSERPSADPLVRLWALNRSVVPTRRHSYDDVSGFDRLLLLHLDGTRTREQLASVVEESRAQEGFAQQLDLPDTSEVPAAIDAALERFRMAALLVS
jgi:methyltransferase-like protein